MPADKKDKKKHRYSPFHPPSYEQYLKDEEKWDNLQIELSKLAKKRARDQHKMQVEKEKSEWKALKEAFGDPFKKLQEQARDPFNWIKEECKELKCDNRDVADEDKEEDGDRCYMRKNPGDQTVPYDCHRLKGTEDVYLCWRCLQNLPICLDHCNVHEGILLASEDMEQPPNLLDASKDPANWVQENGDFEDCVSRGNCWYQGNLDRAGDGTTMYRLKATKDVYLCDVCYDNGLFDKVEDEISIMVGES